MSATKKGSSDVLRNSPAVMTWRRISDIGETRKMTDAVLEWPLVGENQYAAVYDAGGVLVGFWTQEEELAGKALAAAAGGNSCSSLNIVRYPLVSNPASVFVLAPQRLQATAKKLNSERNLSPSIAKSDAGDTVSFVDDDGNFTTFVRPAAAALTGKAGIKLKSLLADIKIDRKRTPNQFIGYNLLVSDLKRSREFYAKVLGLKLLQASKTELSFDIGSAILTLQPEPAVGLVRSLQRAGRLLGDWIMFHVNDIEAATKNLRRRGVKFPEGIEESFHGRGAYFNDPDGHSLSIWEPPDEPESIDYFPQLNRILRQAAQE